MNEGWKLWRVYDIQRDVFDLHFMDTSYPEQAPAGIEVLATWPTRIDWGARVYIRARGRTIIAWEYPMDPSVVVRPSSAEIDMAKPEGDKKP